MPGSLTICLVALAGLGAAPPRSALVAVPLALPEGARGQALAFSPDGAALAAIVRGSPKRGVEEESLLRWGTTVGKRRGLTRLTNRGVVALAYARDGKSLVGLCTGDWPRRLLVWGADGVLRKEAFLRDLSDDCRGLFALPDGSVAWCSPGALGGCFPRTPRRTTLVHGLRGGAVSPDGKLWAHLNHQDIDLYDHEAKKRVRSFLGHHGRVRAVAFRPDGKQLASISHRLDDEVSHTRLGVWGVADGKRALKAPLPPGLKGRGVALSSSGLVAVVGDDADGLGFLRVYDAKGAEVAWSQAGENVEAPVVAFSRDGKYLAACLGGGVRLWRVRGKGRP